MENFKPTKISLRELPFACIYNNDDVDDNNDERCILFCVFLIYRKHFLSSGRKKPDVLMDCHSNEIVLYCKFEWRTLQQQQFIVGQP